jgi:hypothetical protein
VPLALQSEFKSRPVNLDRQSGQIRCLQYHLIRVSHQIISCVDLNGINQLRFTPVSILEHFQFLLLQIFSQVQAYLEFAIEGVLVHSAVKEKFFLFKKLVNC